MYSIHSIPAVAPSGNDKDAAIHVDVLNEDTRFTTVGCDYITQQTKVLVVSQHMKLRHNLSRVYSRTKSLDMSTLCQVTSML